MLYYESWWKLSNCDGLWLFSVSKCWKRLENSVIFPYHFILRHIRYGRVSVERPAVRSETQRFALSVEYRYYPSCRDLSICQKKMEISAPCPQMDFTCFFPGWKTHPKWVRYEANSGAAKLDSEAGRGAGADRFISGVKGEVSAELSDFRCDFLTNLRPFKYVEET